MYVDDGWRPPLEPPSRKPRITKRQERVLVWVLALNALLLLVAPIGGATMAHALMALFR
ncbi:hypothetical protein [Methylobacterium sp. Leaf108]|uniref:hypothetical protein n=1 Tax=Methylobacterium sp. Leaf108 TaxID=1736256 RepID=UPI000B14EA60|nr:hypothetical protein [Methylobacterium sp. Leaf108]